MPITEISRPLNDMERDMLLAIKQQQQNVERDRKNELRTNDLFLLSAAAVVVASIVSMVWLHALRSLFAAAGVVALWFIALNLYKGNRAIMRRKKYPKPIENEADHWLQKNEITVRRVEAMRVAVLKDDEDRDEGDLYIAELGPGQVMYIYDYYFGWRSKTRCKYFDVYPSAFISVVGCNFCMWGDAVDTIEINREAARYYMTDVAMPEHLSVEQMGFEEAVKRFGGEETN